MTQHGSMQEKLSIEHDLDFPALRPIDIGKDSELKQFCDIDHSCQLNIQLFDR
jgi:hypothetical protein